MLNLKRGKGFQKSAANPLLKTLLEGRKIRAVHFRSLSSRAEKSVLFSWRVKGMPVEDNVQELEKMGSHPKERKVMISRRTGLLMPLFSVFLGRSLDNKNNYNLN
ncbi:hypothetical protein TNCV_2133771 [Trichonephila clavipes]|nr:hypothetical protein TNCV_2133771 [Trichonephila clavipes]